jgi:hypothetical protein
MEKLTAVGWLALRYHHRQGYLSQEDIAEAKAMEKSQIEASYIEGAEMAKKVFKEELQEFIVLPKDCIN